VSIPEVSSRNRLLAFIQKYLKKVDSMLVDSMLVGGTFRAPTQPGFSAYASSDQSIPAATATEIEFDEVHWDNGGDFNTSTYTFTAPVTGKYLLTTSVRLDDVDSSSTQYTRIYIITTERTYRGALNSVDENTTVDPRAYSSPGYTVIADMDEGHEATIEVHVYSGTSQTNTGTDTNVTFMGWLLG
tara:strand:- start:2279 stop:2836 length:558 start_codon:yes stop_codon:yes gene_type:complete